MTFKSKVRASLFFATTAVAASLALAHPCGPEGMGHEGMQHIMKDLHLTAQQQAQIKALHEKDHADAAGHKQEMEQMRQWRDAERAAWTAPTVDAAKLESLRQQELRMHDAMTKKHLEHQLALAQILTPAQRQQMAQEMAQERDQKMAHHQGDKPPMPAGAAPSTPSAHAPQ